MQAQTVTQEKLRIEPQIIEGVIWIHPNRVSGAPCFINTRVPIQNLFDYLETGHTLDDFLEGFPPITKKQAVKVLELARTHLLNSLPNVGNPT
ncbi:MAG: DUF433 domain-containing protein [Acidobacteriota bacterium]